MRIISLPFTAVIGGKNRYEIADFFNFSHFLAVFHDYKARKIVKAVLES